ncbi:MAG: 23S rRNA (pseudouridine(1915)-N(3))-methyltransferase RlmH [Chromatiales bacterium]|nr:23S rRNA (pseudouridine(1915)-N(3))-methyltransferase RlmH [Chromatiales bacterium]
MLIRILAVGHRLDEWLNHGFAEYRDRLPRRWTLELVEIPPAPRRTPGVAVRREGEQLLARLAPGEPAVALDERGKQWTSKELATALAGWEESHGRLALLIGGADGLDEAVRARADRTWSLGCLTLPHGLVRVLLAEQVYRAWSILHKHPYHRA